MLPKNAITIITLILSCTAGLFAQEEKKAAKQEDTDVYVIVEEMPTYPGGEKALYQFVSKNIRYPKKALDKGWEDKVTIRFVVNKKGKVSKVHVVSGKYKELNKEAVRVVSMLEGFTPGKQQGKPVKVWYTLPIAFKL